MRSHWIDQELDDVSGIDRWHETIRGADVTYSLYARHLAKVLAARPNYFENKPKLKLVAPGLRIVRPPKTKEDAA